MKYPEDLGFTTKDLKEPSFLPKLSPLYRYIKEEIFNAYMRNKKEIFVRVSKRTRTEAMTNRVKAQLLAEGFAVKDAEVSDGIGFMIRWQNMKYPEDLTFTAQFLKDNPITIRDTTLYKDVKKAIWNNYSQWLHQCRCAATWYEFKENELDVLETLRAEGFDVIINNASNVALI